jgi:hypothetical protein
MEKRHQILEILITHALYHYDMEAGPAASVAMRLFELRVWATCNRCGNYHLPAYKIQYPSGRLVNCNLFADNGRRLVKLVKPVITKHATDGKWCLPKELEESNIHAAGYIGWISVRCGATVGGAV